MFFLKDVINFIFGAALFLNAFLFIPQAIRIVKSKTAEGISLITFLGFLIIQLAIIAHAIIVQDDLLMSGYIFSLMTCGAVVVLALFYRKRQNNNAGPSFEEIIEQLPGHVYWKSCDFTMMGCNQNNWRDFGLRSFGEFFGKTDYDLFPKNVADALRVVDEVVIREGKEQVIEETFLDKNGNKIIYLSHKKPLRNKSGDIIGLIGYSADVTVAKKEVLDKLTMLDNIIAVMPGNVYWMDKNGIYLGCNLNEANSVGLSSRQEIIGKKNIDIPGFVVPEALDSNNVIVLEQGLPIFVEEPAKLSNGEDAVFLSNKVPLRDSNNCIVGLIGISFDITEKKKAEAALIEAKEAAEAADRAKTEFLANMSHDVKTPLSGVIGMADLIAHDAVERDAQRARAIYSCGMQLLAFFNSCLELSQLEMQEWASKNVVFSLQEMLSAVEAIFLPAAQIKGLEFMVKADASLPVAVYGHRASIYRILLNLIGNALKFTANGSVRVQGFLVEMLSPTQACIALEVKDTGIGIPEDKREIIFEKMSRLTPAYEGKIEGSGIGLYIVDQYLKRMNGEIRVDSVEGKGSTFTVFLPLDIATKEELDNDDFQENSTTNVGVPAAMVSAPLPIAEKKLALPKSAPRILLVEDNSLIQHVTQSLLHDSGFLVDIASTGTEALKLFAINKYDLIYMDIGLPDQDGYSVTQAMRAREKALGVVLPVPVIALTAHGALDVEAFCMRSGMQGVLSKPLSREQASAIWAKFGLGKACDVPGLTIIRSPEIIPLEQQIIDIDGTIALLGSREYANELLALWEEMLTHRFLPALKDFVAKRDDEALRQELHTMLGSLCYVKTPLLNQAVLELQAAARNHPNNIEAAYRHMLAEAQRFVDQYKKMTIIA